MYCAALQNKSVYKAHCFFSQLQYKVSIVQNKRKRKSYGQVVFHRPPWRVRNGAANNPQYSMSRFNNQLHCEPLSNAEFCKAQLICCRNERLANCDSPQILRRPEMSAFVWDIWMRVCVWAWGAAKWKANKQLESDADSLMTGRPARVHACMWRVCTDECSVEGWVRGLKDTTSINQLPINCMIVWRRL